MLRWWRGDTDGFRDVSPTAAGTTTQQNRTKLLRFHAHAAYLYRLRTGTEPAKLATAAPSAVSARHHHQQSAPYVSARSAVKSCPTVGARRTHETAPPVGRCNSCQPRATTVFRSTPSRLHLSVHRYNFRVFHIQLTTITILTYHVTIDNSTHNT